MNNYQTGTAADINVLLTTLDTFLVSVCGYTRNLTPTVVGSGRRAHYQITTPRGNTLYANFRSFRKEAWNTIYSPYITNPSQGALIDGLAMNLSKAYTGTGVLWDIQGGQPTSGDNYFQAISVHAGAHDNIPTYHFFNLTNPHLVVIVLEWLLGKYSYLIWGEPNSDGAGVYNPNNGYFFMGNCLHYYPFNYGGSSVFPDPYDFYMGSFPPMGMHAFYYSPSAVTYRCQNQFFQLDPSLHTGANGWLGPATAQSYSTRNSTYVGGSVGNDLPGLLTSFATESPNLPSWNSRVPKWFAQTDYWAPTRRSSNTGVGVSVFLPHYFYWYRATNTAVYLGSLPEVYHIFMRDLTPGQTIVLGSDQYLVFPYNQKQSPFSVDWAAADYRQDRAYGMGMVVKKN